MSLTIRPERPADRAAIFAVHGAAFPTDAEARLVDRLRETGDSVISLVSETTDGAIVGHVLYSPVTLINPAGQNVASGLGLAPVAVLPAFQRRGIAAELIRRGNQAAAAAWPFVVVLGEPHYYQRFDFTPAHPLGIDNEYGAHDEFMILLSQPATLPTGRLLAKYGPAFAELT